LTVRIKEEGNLKSFTNYCDIKFSNNWLTTELYCIRSHHEQVPGRPAAAEAPHWAAEVWGPDHPLQSVPVHWWPAEVLRRPHWGGLPHPGLQQAQREPLQGKRKLPNIVVGADFSFLNICQCTQVVTCRTFLQSRHSCCTNVYMYFFFRS